MEGAVKNRIPGIDADCGGACACATCHVYVDPSLAGRAAAQIRHGRGHAGFRPGPASCGRRWTNSRLSCQIRVTSDLDGHQEGNYAESLIVRLAVFLRFIKNQH
jgi:ferredoxin, 2Fe-2S